MALEYVKEKYNDTIDFKYVYRDGGRICGPAKAAHAASEVYYSENVTVFIGPACSLAVEQMAYMATIWNIPVITPSGTSGILADKEAFPILIRIAFGMQEFAALYLKLFKLYSWRHVALLYESDVSFNKIIGGTFYEAFRTSRLSLVHFQISKDMTFEESRHVLRKANENARVFVLLATTKTIRKLMLAAHSLQYTNGDHVFIATYPVYEKMNIWYKNDENDSIAMEAAQSLLLVNLEQKFDSEYIQFNDELVSRSYIDYGFDYGDIEPNILLPRFYDAVLIYAEILNETLVEGGDPLDGLAIVTKMKNRTFHGKSGRISINANGDRYTDLVLYDMTLPDMGAFEIVGFYDGKLQEYTPNYYKKIQWPGDKGPPPDIPECGFRDDTCPQQGLSKVFVISLSSCFGALAVMTFIIGILCYRRWRGNARQDLWWWKIQLEELIFDKRTQNGSSISFMGRGISVHHGLCLIYLQRASLKSEINNFSDVHVGIALYKGITVQVRELNVSDIPITNQLLNEFKEIRDINQNNIVKVFGACFHPISSFLVIEHCSKGTLQDVVGNTEIKLDAHFKFSLAIDIAQGMTFIHQSSIHHHGNLSSMVCLIDNRFSVKITDVGLRYLYSYIKKDKLSQEYINGKCNYFTKEGDVYSFGIILQEILTRDSPFSLETSELGAKDVLMKVKENSGEPFRPKVDHVSPNTSDMLTLMKKCWQEDPHSRPIFSSIVKELKHMTSGNLLDNLLRRMELYANNLEKMVDEKTLELNEEKKRSEELLYQILPRSVAERLKRGLRVEPEAFDCITIYFSDICGFTTISARSKPMEVVNLLNDLYSCFDDILEGFDVYKVETIGDAYMVASGLPQRNGHKHAEEIARMSLALLKAIDSFRMRHLPDEKLKLRIGLHSGPVCAGVVGVKMPRYCLFGDTVNTASRMESHGEGLKIHMSESTNKILQQNNFFEIVKRGDIEIKVMNTSEYC
ncbi:hypothetical protein LOTGIDRAFT_138137 [Lottia gigantea]|uniref:Guanylate cyclase n=1 Tax=Lottia gigantea TaxID=225164 RepID=V4BA20_LOTGI|nr:hypothetical protein LOTGIDRAFT_138137 [Lottia gigantea]ESP02582.1 hypothetical protein LOTGIDRAFT_138137 [Lottia gigantea]